MTGIIEQNKALWPEWGTMWDDWMTRNPRAKNKPPYKHLGAIDSIASDIRNELPPHKSNKFYSWWKHTPAQHPMINCFRSDTLYVIMVRHPVAWKKSTSKTPYGELFLTLLCREFNTPPSQTIVFVDLKYDRLKKVWRLDRTSKPRRLPTFQIQFKSLYHAWAYWMNGYLGWESVAAQTNCYEPGSNEPENCLGGENSIPSNRRNMILVRQEDYSYDPQKVLAEIFQFATRGAIDAKKDKHLFVLSEERTKATNYAEEMEVSLVKICGFS
jgi:hypothetical protein